MMESMDLYGNTVLVFLSEQGIAMPRGKWSPYEHGSRALCLAHWQGHIQARETQALAMYCDIVLTLIDFAGGTVDPKLDGKSLKSLWTSDSIDGHRDSVLISNVQPFWQKAIVTDQYKLIWTGNPDQEHIFTNFSSKSKYFSKPWQEWVELKTSNETARQKIEQVTQPKEIELYDLKVDPYEMKDLATLSEHKTRKGAQRSGISGFTVVSIHDTRTIVDAIDWFNDDRWFVFSSQKEAA